MPLPLVMRAQLAFEICVKRLATIPASGLGCETAKKHQPTSRMPIASRKLLEIFEEHIYRVSFRG